MGSSAHLYDAPGPGSARGFVGAMIGIAENSDSLSPPATLCFGPISESFSRSKGESRVVWRSLRRPDECSGERDHCEAHEEHAR
jgi:hypothetical protein